MTVAENNLSDISAAWLQINSPTETFESTVRIRPRRIEAGVAFNFFARLTTLCDLDCDWINRWWISGFIPVQWVQHNLHLEECTNEVAEDSPFANARQAFNNNEWCFGKLPCKALSKWGVADILLQTGYDFLLDDLNHLSLYACGFIPTSKVLKSEVLFEPTLGNLGHAGLGFGLDGDWCIWECNDYSYLNWLTDIRYAYFFKRKERRMSDLFFNEDWSRYLLVAHPDDLETPLPGINFFTQELTIKPRSTVNFWTALHWAQGSCHAELGYNFWWRQQEIATGFCDPNVVIFDITGVPGERTSASTATIRNGQSGPGAPLSDPVPVLVTANDFSLESPTIPNIYISTFYVSVGHTLTYDSYYSMLSVGASYDWSHRNSGFDGFGGWLKYSLEF